jgi:hypothetical protein
MTIQEFLMWLFASGGAAVVLSFIEERWPLFQTWSPEAKSWFNLGGTLVISLAAYAVLTYVPADVLAALAPWFAIVATVVGAWISSQVAHAVDPKTKK